MIGESNQNEFLIQIDALNFAEFKISEFEISRFDCIYLQEIVETGRQFLSVKLGRISH